MKQFIIKLTLFLVILAAIDFSFGQLFTYLQNRAPYGNWQRFRYINNEMTDDIIIMGSSRASHHYVPQMIEDSLDVSCYNCGVDGNGILMFLANYRMFSERYQPKVIVYDLSGFDVNPDDHSTYLGWLKPYYNRNGVAEIIDDIDPLEKYKLQSHLYQWNFKFIQLLTDNVAQFVHTEKGYKPLSGTMNYEPGKDNNQHTSKESKYEYDDLKIRYLKEIILSCKRNGTQLILALSPFYNATSSEKFRPIFDFASEQCVAVFDMLPIRNFHLTTDISRIHLA